MKQFFSSSQNLLSLFSILYNNFDVMERNKRREPPRIDVKYHGSYVTDNFNH